MVEPCDEGRGLSARRDLSKCFRAAAAGPFELCLLWTLKEAKSPVMTSKTRCASSGTGLGVGCQTLACVPALNRAVLEHGHAHSDGRAC